MKKHLFATVSIALASIISCISLSAQGVRQAGELTRKGIIDVKSTFDPVRLDSLLACDDYVMLIASFNGCGPCEWLRGSDIFDTYPISPYYTDFMLDSANESVPYTFGIEGFPTCMIFDRSGEIVAIIAGTARFYEKLDRVVEGGEKFSELRIDGVPEDRLLPYYNLMYKANAAYLKNAMNDVCKYAGLAADIHADIYNMYLMWKYYESEGDISLANQYAEYALMYSATSNRALFRKLIAELTGEEAE